MIYRMTGLDVGLLAALVVLFLLAVFVGDKTANFTPVMDIAKIDGWNSLGLVAYAAFLLLPTALHIKEAIQWHISRSRICRFPTLPPRESTVWKMSVCLLSKENLLLSAASPAAARVPSCGS